MFDEAGAGAGVPQPEVGGGVLLKALLLFLLVLTFEEDPNINPAFPGLLFPPNGFDGAGEDAIDPKPPGLAPPKGVDGGLGFVVPKLEAPKPELVGVLPLFWLFPPKPPPKAPPPAGVVVLVVVVAATVVAQFVMMAEDSDAHARDVSIIE